MFSLIVVVFIALFGVFLLVLRENGLKNRGWEKNEGRTVVSVMFGIVSLVVAGLWFSVMTLGSYRAQLYDFSELKGTRAEIALYQERRDNLAIMVKTELSKYPEYEKKIIGDIKPAILLQFPALKSNETIVKTVEEIVKLEDQVYKTMAKLIETQQKMFYREISPWVICVTPYKTLIGEANPLG